MASSYHHGNLRSELLERAIKVLSESGAEALSLRGLARDLGVSHTAPLRHFPSKGDLMSALAFQGISNLIERTKVTLMASQAVERLLQMSIAYVEWALQNPALHQVLKNPDVMRHASDDLKAKLEKYSELRRTEIAQAQKEGWRKDTDPEVLFLHLTSLTTGMALVATDPVYRGPFKDTSIAQNVSKSFRLFLNGNS